MKQKLFHIYQSFETLGDPCSEYHVGEEAAEVVRTRMVELIADFILESEDFSTRPDDFERYGRCGSIGEHAAWDAAFDSVGGDEHRLDRKAALIVAEAAVMVEEVEET